MPAEMGRLDPSEATERDRRGGRRTLGSVAAGQPRPDEVTVAREPAAWNDPCKRTSNRPPVDDAICVGIFSVDRTCDVPHNSAGIHDTGPSGGRAAGTVRSARGMRRILVAEDDPMLREILCTGLSDEGFDVVAAEDGQAALELYHGDGPYDALLVDDEMPRLTGRELLSKLRQAGERVAALIISGNLVLSEAERDLLGVGPVLRKPLSINELTRAISQLIETV
jgi:CheY-like chemotaxis protein